MPFLFDPLVLLLIPPVILALYANSKVRSTFREYSQRIASTGLTGAEAAARLLRHNGLDDVTVEPIPGDLTDHYDPRKRVLRLSEAVYYSNSLSALGVAAHETGHAIQDDRGYMPLKLRQGIFPLAAVGNNLGIILFMIGMIMLAFTGGRGAVAQVMAEAGILLFSAGTIFTIVTLPVEFNASKRALVMLVDQGIVSPRERDDAKKVLDAAALTYVAAAFMAIMMLLRFILLFLGTRRN